MDTRQAIEHCFHFLRANPQRGDVWGDFASALRSAGQTEHALRALRTALLLDPADVASWFDRAALLEDLGEPDAASYRRALLLNPQMALIHNNVGNCFNDPSPLRHAVALEPGMTEAWYNLGRVSEDLPAFERALAIQPDHAVAHTAYGAALLGHGRMEQGWREYEWRWQTPLFAPHRRYFPQPRWQGEGGTVLLHGEQGFGDMIQFARYAIPAARLARIILEVPEPLVRLMRGIDGVDAVVARGATLPLFDYHCPLMSLPQLFPDPPPAPYLSAGDWPALPGHGRKIGLVWSGSSQFHDHRRKAVPLEALAPLWKIPGVAWFSLQLGAPCPPEITDLAPRLTDFAETAAALSRLDLLITVDTAVAHLAGALGRPAWLMLSLPLDWRWRGDWYSSLRHFPQKTPGDWESVIADLVSALDGWRR